MQYKRIIAAGLTCAVLLTLPVSALAVRKGVGGPRAAGTQSSSQILPIVGGPLSFDQIESRVLAGNLNVRAAKEGLEQAKAMDWNKALSEMDDAIDDMEDLIESMSGSSADSMSAAVAGIAQAFAMAQSADESMQETAAALLAANVAQLSAGTTVTTYSSIQAKSLEGTLESLEDQRDDLKKQRDEYPKTIQDTERMVDSTVDQIVSGAQSLYLTILTTQLQYESLLDTAAAMERTVKEMELRYDLGQISAQTLLQVQNGKGTLDNTVASLENTLATLRASLQSLMGETPDGKLVLVDTPQVSQSELDSIRYDSDLAKAKAASYTLYNASRSVEKARDALEDARKDNGRNSYQYQMADHALQSALYQESAAISSFELSFRNLYRAIAPASATLKVKEADLAYQEQVYAAAELRYSQGNLSANALKDAENTLSAAKRDAESARLDLFTAWNAYRQAVDKGVVSG